MRLIPWWVVALCCVVSLSFAATDVSLAGNKSENAYATIFYEGTPRDYEYFLGARVAMYSIKKSGSFQDRIVFVSPNVRQEWRSIFENDGLRVIEVDNLANPYTDNAKYLDRFKYSLNKLYAWALTQYRRVVMIDADVIAVKNPDELFLCGHFCALFMNPCHFHTGLIVLRPSKDTFKHLITSLRTTPSHDAADQGFLDNAFPDLADAPLFNAARGQSERPLERLNIGYNMHHLYYYEKFNWELYSCSPIVTLGYPIGQPLKPWYWWTYPLLDLHYWWQDLRLELPEQEHNYAARCACVIAAYIIAFLLLKYAIHFPPSSCEPMLLNYARPLGLVFGLVASLFSIQLASKAVPAWLPPVPGWLFFCAFYVVFFYFLTCCLGLVLFTCNSRHMPSTALKHRLLLTALQRSVLVVPIYVLFFWLLGANIYGNIIYKAAAALTTTVIVVSLQSLVCWQVLQVFLKPENAEGSFAFGRE